MKRTSLTLSVLGVSILGCLALNSTASAASASGGWGPDPCVVVYDYCIVVDGNPEAYCEALYQECLLSGQATSQDHLQAKNNRPPSGREAGPQSG